MPYKMQKLEEGIRGAVSFIDAIHKKDIALMALILDDSCVLHTWNKDEVIQGKELILKYYEHFFTAHPEVQVKVKEIHNMGKKCFIEAKIDFQSVDKPANSCILFFEVKNTKLTHISLYTKI